MYIGLELFYQWAWAKQVSRENNKQLSHFQNQGVSCNKSFMQKNGDTESHVNIILKCKTSLQINGRANIPDFFKTSSSFLLL